MVPQSYLIEPEEFITADSDEPRVILATHNTNMSIAADIRSQLLSLIAVIKSRNDDN